MRDDIKEYSGELAIRRMQQLHMINDLLNGISICDVDTSRNFEKTDLLISGEDFYISFKGDKTEIYILDRRKKCQRTTDEINYILKTMKNKQNGSSL